LLRSGVEAAGQNLVGMGPIQFAANAMWNTGFEAMREGKSPMAALTEALHAGKGQLLSPSNLAMSLIFMGIGPAKMKLLEPFLENQVGKRIANQAVSTAIHRTANIAVDTAGMGVGQGGGLFAVAYISAI